MTIFPDLLICPLDGQSLTTQGHTARCTNGHSFDWAKERYLNLLPVQAKQSKDPGDSIEMVQARRRFLSAGYYDPIIAAIQAQITAHDHMVDAGCGEGTYLHIIQRERHAAVLYGVDISKQAVRAAAKQNATITWLVASNKHLPFADQSLDVVLCAFGFPVWAEFKRVLKAGGRVILIDPRDQHLIELRRMLYSDVKTKHSDFVIPDGFNSCVESHVTHLFHPTSDHLRDLIAMTPHQHRVPQDIIDATIATGCPDLTLDVSMRILQS